MKELIGKRTRAVFMNEDSNILIFVLDKGDKAAMYLAVGDCCSTSWIESIENIEALKDMLVIAVDVISEGALEHDENDYDCIKGWGYAIQTMLGETRFELRNESNGYYSGDLEFVKTPITFSKINDEYWIEAVNADTRLSGDEEFEKQKLKKIL